MGCHDNNAPVDSATQEDKEKMEEGGEGEGGREGEEGGEGEGEEGEVKEKDPETEKQDGAMDLFQLMVVNSYGSQDVQKLKDDKNPLRLSSE